MTRRSVKRLFSQIYTYCQGKPAARWRLSTSLPSIGPTISCTFVQSGSIMCISQHGRPTLNDSISHHHDSRGAYLLEPSCGVNHSFPPTSRITLPYVIVGVAPGMHLWTKRHFTQGINKPQK